MFLGNFEIKDEVKIVYDLVVLKYDVSEIKKGKLYFLNFFEYIYVFYMRDYVDWSICDFVWKIRRFLYKFSKGKFRFKGVSIRKWKRM